MRTEARRAEARRVEATRAEARHAEARHAEAKGRTVTTKKEIWQNENAKIVSGKVGVS